MLNYEGTNEEYCAINEKVDREAKLAAEAVAKKRAEEEGRLAAEVVAKREPKKKLAASTRLTLALEIADN